MNILKTDKETLTPEEILAYISAYEKTEVPKMDKLWEYYLGHNTTITNRGKAKDVNNPDNRIKIPYGRKIITTYSGYAFRPKYITYKPVETKEKEQKEDKSLLGKVMDKAKEMFKKNITIQTDAYFQQINDNFKINKEWIKTNRAGRNTAIFGVAYELVYIDSETKFDVGISKELITTNIPKFVSVDPREMILLYDYSIEPKIKVAIRFYKTEGVNGRVEVYYNDRVELYDRIKETTEIGVGKEVLKLKSININFFERPPVVAYYFGDEMNGLIEPVLDLIDAYDVLVSDSMNEFDRFAFAYLIMKKFGLSDMVKKQSPEMTEATLQKLKKKRMFEHLPEGAEISFLTKDIPTQFIEYMTKLLRDQIHIQSHVPDFTMMTGALTGAAIDRLLFDFENVVSSAEADFDVGLATRIELITLIYIKSKRGVSGSPDMIAISHKRNKPNNLAEIAQTANQMKAAGFSRYLIADIMPDDIVPDVEEELRRQDEDMEAMMPDIENMGFGNDNTNPNENQNVDEDGNVIE